MMNNPNPKTMPKQATFAKVSYKQVDKLYSFLFDKKDERKTTIRIEDSKETIKRIMKER